MAATASDHSPTRKSTAPRPLAGVRIYSLALTLPGPAALMRCLAMGARCVKLAPHFAQAMRAPAGVADASRKSMLSAATREAIAALLATRTRKQLDRLAHEQDVPMHVLPA